VSPELDLAWRIHHDVEDDIFVVKVAVPGALTTRTIGSLPNTEYGWYRNNTHNDWHPASTDKNPTTPVYDLFDVLMTVTLDSIVAWLAANRPGDTLDVMGIFALEAESDSTDAERVAVLEKAMSMVRDTMRSRIATRGVSTIDAAKIPFVLTKHSTSGVWPLASSTNALFDKMSDDDLYTGVVETSDLAAKTLDPAHWNGASLATIGRRWYEKWVELRSREKSSLQPASNLLTLGEIRSRVLRRYERNDVSNDATPIQVRNFINDGLREIKNEIGDNAWFLRRIETFSISANSNTVITLPRVIRRLYRIESILIPQRPVQWSHLGHTDDGRLQIVCREPLGGDTRLHHMVLPKDLVEDGDTCLLPEEYIEWLVMLTCKRFAETSGNQSLLAYYTAESMRLAKYVKRDCMRYDRARHEALFTYDDGIETTSPYWQVMPW
jgi:hypothetical protein